MTLHASITLDRVAEAVERQMTTLDDPGFCTECGFEATGVEPDAEDFECESCGAIAVQGADNLLIQLM